MTKAHELAEECGKASIALAAWFRSQGMNTQQALGTMAILMATIISVDGDERKAGERYNVTDQLMRGMVEDMLAKKGDR